MGTERGSSQLEAMGSERWLWTLLPGAARRAGVWQRQGAGESSSLSVLVTSE